MKLNNTIVVLGTVFLLQLGGANLYAAPDLSQQATDQTLAAAISKLNSVYQPAGPDVTMPAQVSVPAQTVPAQTVQQPQVQAPAKPVQPSSVAQTPAKPAAPKDDDKVITLDLRPKANKKTTVASARKEEVLRKRAAALKRSGVISDANIASAGSDVLDRRRSQLASAAMSFRGTPYVWGGDSPGAFDCSGFTQYLYKKHFGISLPHSAAIQYNMGKPVSSSNLAVGDLVFFANTGGRKGITHVGMYIGSGKMIHAANPRRGVRVDSLSGYYSQTFAGARRYR